MGSIGPVRVCGTTISVVSSALVLPPPSHAKKLHMESVTGDTILLPVTEVEVILLGEKRKLKALCYDHAPVDVMLGTDFKKMLVQAEGLAEIFQVSTRSQAAKP